MRTLVDVRVPRDSVVHRPAFMLGLSDLEAIRPHPPAAGPEVELNFVVSGALGADRVRARLEGAGIAVLALRCTVLPAAPRHRWRRGSP